MPVPPEKQRRPGQGAAQHLYKVTQTQAKPGNREPQGFHDWLPLGDALTHVLARLERAARDAA